MPALVAFLAGLEERRIQYVLIGRRSRTRLNLAGEGDLDVLVARAHAARVEMLLLEHGFKERRSDGGVGEYAVTDYVKEDPETGKQVHLQLHHEVRLGHSVAPSFRLPIVDQLIAGSALDGPARVPEPSLQLTLYLVRRLLALEASDLFFALAGGRSRSEPFDPVELRMLIPIVSEAQFISSARRLFPMLQPEWLSRIHAEASRLSREEIDWVTRLRLTAIATSLRRALSVWSDRPLWLSWLRSLYRRTARLLSAVTTPVTSRSHVRRRQDSAGYDGTERTVGQ